MWILGTFVFCYFIYWILKPTKIEKFCSKCSRELGDGSGGNMEPKTCKGDCDKKPGPPPSPTKK